MFKPTKKKKLNQKAAIALCRREARKVGLIFKRTEKRLLGSLSYAFYDKGRRVTVYMSIAGAVKGLKYLESYDPVIKDFWEKQE